MSETVSFKVCLRKTGGKEETEVRRFCVDHSTNFSQLQEKLREIFPSLKDEIFVVTWTDEDNDSVTISTDDELNIAMNEMTGPFHRFNITVKRGEKRKRGNRSGPVHPGVVCDGCDKVVSGFRYKCLVCEDYDLCGRCETAGLHSGHNMMRIDRPNISTCSPASATILARFRRRLPIARRAALWSLV